MIDRERLNAQVAASGYKKKYLAQAMGMSAATLQNKLLGEAQQLGFLLGLSEEEQAQCFWALK